MKSINKPTNLLIVIACAALFSGACGRDSTNHTHKMMMPQSYQVRLLKGEYWVWVFSTWKPRVIGDYSPREIKISTDNGQEITQEPFDEEFLYSNTERFGKRRCRVTIPKSGMYTVIPADQENNQFVAVLAPAASHSWSAGSDMVFDGISDDTFDAPLKTVPQSHP